MSANGEQKDHKKETTSAEVVRPFVNPVEEFRSMARLNPGEAITWAIFLNRHAHRPSRNEHRIKIARDAALLTRSEEAFGSQQAAEVAKNASSATESILDKLMGTGQAQKRTNPKEGDEE